MNSYKRIPESLLATGLLICLTCLFFSKVLFQGGVFFSGDNLTINLPSKVLFFRTIWEGHLPLWNPYAFSGTPFLADINLGILSPFNILYFFLPPLRALTLDIVLAVFIAGVGTYFYGRKIGLNLISALTAAAVFMFSGSLMTHTLNTAVLNTIVWLPFILFFLESLFAEQKLKYAILSSVMLSFSLFGGHIQYFYYILLVTLAYLVSQPIDWKRRLVYITFIYVPALLLTAIQWVPFLEYAGYSTRPAKDVAYAGTVSLVSFIRLLLPNFFGIAKDGTSWGATADINGYVGIIPLCVTTYALFSKKNRVVWFFVAVAAVALLLSLGSRSPVYLLFFHLLPFFSRFRSPAGILVIYSFSIALLTGMALHNLKKIKFPVAMLFALAILLMLAFLLNRDAYGYIVPLMEKINTMKRTGFISRFLEYSPARDRIIFSLWLENMTLALFTVFAFILFVFLRMKKVITPTLLSVLLFILTVSDLFFYGHNAFIVSTTGNLMVPDQVRTFFSKEKEPFRALTYPDPGAKPPFADAAYFQNEAEKAIDLLQPNTNILYRVEAVGGYASIVRRDYASYISDKKSSDPTGITLPVPGTRQIDELNVKYILTGGSQMATLSAIPYYRPVLSYTDKRLKRTFTVFENGHMLPRAYISGGSGAMVGNAAIVSRSANFISLQSSSVSGGRLVLSEMSYPGWYATLDSKPVRIEAYKGVFRSVDVPPGTHRIELTFRPRLTLAAGIISIVNWLYMLGFLVFLLGSKQIKIGEKLHIGKPGIKKNA